MLKLAVNQAARQPKAAEKFQPGMRYLRLETSEPHPQQWKYFRRRTFLRRMLRLMKCS